jgi:hypothetical protein
VDPPVNTNSRFGPRDKKWKWAGAGGERVNMGCVNQGGIGPSRGKSVLFSFLDFLNFKFKFSCELAHVSNVPLQIL